MSSIDESRVAENSFSYRAQKGEKKESTPTKNSLYFWK